jgi:hypothetical protein
MPIELAAAFVAFQWAGVIHRLSSTDLLDMIDRSGQEGCSG